MKTSMKIANVICVGAFTLALVGCGQKTTTTEKGATVVTKDTPKMTLSLNQDESIRRGNTEKVTVSVKRENFVDPVKVSVSGLPKGVETVDSGVVIASADKSATITLKAAGDAPIGEFPVTVTAEAPTVNKNVQTFVLKVKE